MATALVASVLVIVVFVLFGAISMETFPGGSNNIAVQRARWGAFGIVEVETTGPLGGPALRRTVQVSPKGALLTLLVLGAAGGVSVSLARLYVREMRLPAHRCDECGYELGAAGSVQCPECGTPATPADARPSRAAAIGLALAEAAGVLVALGMTAAMLAGLWLPQLAMRGSMAGQPFREDFRNGWLAWRTVSRTWPNGGDAAPVEVVAIDAMRLAATIGLTAVGLTLVGVLVLAGRRRLAAGWAPRQGAEP